MTESTDETFTESSEREGRISLGFWVGLVVILGTTGYIVSSSMANTVHYHEVHQVTDDADLVGKTMRLRGKVVEHSHRVRTGTLDEHIFLMSSEQETITVLYTGALPDQFQGGADVIVVGSLASADTFEAESVTAQCPSRYEGEAPTAGGNDINMGSSE